MERPFPTGHTYGILPCTGRVVRGPKLKRAGLLLIAGLFALPTLAAKHGTAAPCQTNFTVVQQDALKNIRQGLSQEQMKWFDKKLREKYPDVCYVAPGPDVRLVFYIIVTPDVYHGTRVETDTETHNNPVNGTITDQNGDTADVSGTVQATTTSSTAVPYTVHYGIYTLTIETSEGLDHWKARHRVQQRGLYSTLAGIPLGGKGHHPTRTVIEEAMKWVHEGGLANPLETVAPQ